MRGEETSTKVLQPEEVQGNISYLLHPGPRTITVRPRAVTGAAWDPPPGGAVCKGAACGKAGAGGAAAEARAVMVACGAAAEEGAAAKGMADAAEGGATAAEVAAVSDTRSVKVSPLERPRSARRLLSRSLGSCEAVGRWLKSEKSPRNSYAN